MKRQPLLLVFTAAWLVASLCAAHDLFLKLDSYLLTEGVEVELALINGTFEKSENAIARDRMLDVTIAGPGDELESPPLESWWERDDTTWLALTPAAPGTYLAGVSTRARTIELPADDFNGYLEHDGVLDALEARKRDGKLGEDARELYSKHVKAIYQVGEPRTGAWARRLGYPIEIVPLRNPYELLVGDTLEVLVLRDGEPVAEQLVYASHVGFHAHAESGDHAEAVRTRTGDDGVASIELSTAGIWYVRLIHMVESTDGEHTHESNWATLTFEIARDGE